MVQMPLAATSLVIIQPTPFCNIDCSYCYLPSRADRTRLDIGQITSIFNKLLTFPTIHDRIAIVWHAGEPLVLGVPYYEEQGKFHREQGFRLTDQGKR